MNYIYKESKGSNKTYILLHGTGGDEHDLIPLLNHLDENAGFLSVRGEVNENGMNRFFKRLAPGVFDLEDLAIRTENLYSFIQKIADDEKIKLKDIVFLGYSNGANIAANLLLTYGNQFKGAILLHPMVPRRSNNFMNLNQTSVLITAGKQDPMCSVEETEELFNIFKKQEALIDVEYFEGGHSISRPELDYVKKWIKALK